MTYCVTTDSHVTNCKDFRGGWEQSRSCVQTPFNDKILTNNIFPKLKWLHENFYGIAVSLDFYSKLRDNAPCPSFQRKSLMVSQDVLVFKCSPGLSFSTKVSKLFQDGSG